MKIVWIFAFIITVQFVSGCCSIIHGGTQRISFTTEPRDVRIEVAGQNGITPTNLVLNRGREYRAYFSKEGYEPQEISLTKGLDAGWYLIGNFFMWPGYFVDAITGSMWNIQPEDVYIKMIPFKDAALLKKQGSSLSK